MYTASKQILEKPAIYLYFTYVILMIYNFWYFFKIRPCISRFKDCPLCGADIKKIEPDTNLQSVVDRFIEGHARIKRSQVNSEQEKEEGANKKVIYEDVSFERGAFLVQQAMRVSRQTDAFNNLFILRYPILLVLV